MTDKKSSNLFFNAAEDVKHSKDFKQIDDSENPAYRLAYNDLDFLLRDELRPVRLMLELTKPELSLQDHGIDNTVVVFGSARIREASAAAIRRDQLQQQCADQPDNIELANELKMVTARSLYAQYYNQARELASLVSTHSGCDDIPKLTVVTGGGPGIMEAANRGADDTGGKSVGLNIVLPEEQESNRYITPSLCFQFHYFAIRKLHFLLRCKAMVVFPGGFGTLDELFETLTLVQTNKVKPMPILLFGKDYWQKLINFEFLVEQGMISKQDLSYFRYVDNAAQAWEIIKDSTLNSPPE